MAHQGRVQVHVSRLPRRGAVGAAIEPCQKHKGYYHISDRGDNYDTIHTAMAQSRSGSPRAHLPRLPGIALEPSGSAQQNHSQSGSARASKALKRKTVVAVSCPLLNRQLPSPRSIRRKIITSFITPVLERHEVINEVINGPDIFCERTQKLQL